MDQCLPSDWPSQYDFIALLNMAVALFIVATTLCRFIGDRRMAAPHKQLEKVVSQSIDGVAQLEGTYRSVLDTLIAGLSIKQQERVLQEFRKVVGAIVLLERPLSTSALARVINMSKDDIDSRLALLHGVLNIPSSAEAPVRLLHLSFRDFLLEAEDPAMQFMVNEKQTHAALVANCLRIVGGLKQNICDMEYPGASYSDISAEKITLCLPPEVQYACVYWVCHLEKADMYVADGTDAHIFLLRHFLHWIEALVILGKASECLSLLRKLQARVKVIKKLAITNFHTS